MHIDVGSPYNCAKLAMRYALGSVSSRPRLVTINKNILTFTNDIEIFEFDFPELNYDYANKTALEDISVFDQKEYGKFFYEYGRALLANLIIAITKLDWYSAGSKAQYEMRFVSEYFDELLKLNQRTEEVLAAFTGALDIVEKRKAVPAFDFLTASRELQHIKNKNAYSSESFDMHNSLILAAAYTGIWFSSIGYLLLFCEQNDIDGLSRLVTATVNKDAVKLFFGSLARASISADDKVKICSLLFSFFSINRFYLITSGLTIQDPLLDVAGKIAFQFMDLIQDEKDLIIIDTDLIYGTGGETSSIARFTEKYDPLNDIVRFSNEGIIKNDNTNIWAFGKTYIRFYKDRNEDSTVNLFDFIEPAYKKYIEKYASLSRYLEKNSIDIERSFLYLRNLITGVEKEKLSAVCPGTILQLNIIAAAYRTIEKSPGFRRLNDERKRMIHMGIEIADMIVAVLYQLWFYSHKFFVQPKRPFYSKDTARDTLNELQKETLLILEEYFEFAAFCKDAGNPLFKEIARIRYFKGNDITEDDIVNKFYSTVDPVIYMRECAYHNKTIIYSVLCEEINHIMSINNLTDIAHKTPLDESITRKLAAFKAEKDPAYFDIPILDAIMKVYHIIRPQIEDKPENYFIAIYTVLYDTLDNYMRKQTLGNYFDFGNADNLVKSYKVESIVSELIRKPLHITSS